MKAYVSESRMESRNPRRRRLSLPLTIGLLSVLSVVVALADQLCFNHVTAPGAPPNFGAPPLIDGSIVNGDTRWIPTGGPDLGWTNSFSYVFNNPDGPVIPDVIVQGIRDDTHLYLSVQANNTTPTGGGSSDPNNAVVVAFDPDNTGTKMQWLVIYPVLVGGTNGNKKNAQSVEFYWNQNSLSSPLTDGSHYVLNPSWLPGSGAGSSNASCATAGTTCIQSDLEGASWYMEMALPLLGTAGDPSKGLIIPPTGHYGMYIDVLRIVSGGQWAQAPWPSGAAIPGCLSTGTCYLNTSIPATSNWGNGTIDPSPSPACTGVSIGSQNLDITVSNPTNPFPPGSNQIDGMNPNIFHANVHNSGSAPASNVVVSFSIANWGLPSSLSWQQVAVSQPPSGSPIPNCAGPAACATLNSNGWTPPSPSAYAPPHEHQCILATLTSNPPNSTLFTNNSAVQNANFFNTSRVERVAQVSSKGYPVNPQHNTEQEFDIVVRTTQDVINPCTIGAQTRGANATGTPPNCNPISQLIETAEGCRHTGMYLLDRNKQKVEICQAVGSFTFIAKHEGTVKNWGHQLTGPGLGRPNSAGVYHLRMANDSVVDLHNVVDSAGPIGTGGCFHLFGFGVSPLLLGGIFIVGLTVYRPWKRKSKE